MVSPAPADLLLEQASLNPDAMMRELDRLDAEESLSDYAQLMWPVIEPARPLIRGRSWDVMCEHLEAVHYGDIRRLLMNVPPGFSKSLLLNVFLPSWEWGPKNRPDLRHLSFSYSANLTIRDNRKCRSIIQSDLYQHLWGDRFFLVSDQNAKTRFDTNRAGWKYASSVGGVGMGERGDRLGIDDPNNVKTVESEAIRNEALYWFGEVIPTRINDPDKSAIIVIQQRTHQSDVTGLILREELNYEWVCLPMEYEEGRRCFTAVPREGFEPERVRRVKLEEDAIPTWLDADEEIPSGAEKVGPVRMLWNWEWRTEEGELLAPERYSREFIEADLKPPLRAMGGTYAEAGQLQQRPAPRGGGMFQRGDFTIIEPGDLPDGLMPARGYDLAGTEDNTSPWSAGVKIAVAADGRIFILHVDRVRKKPGGVLEWMKQLAEQDGYGVEIDFPQDPGQAGKWQKGWMGGQLADYVVRSSPETGSKEDRARGLAAQSELGNVYLLRGSWNDTFIAEACLFPRGDFKDQIDAASRAYARARKLQASADSPPVGPTVIGG